MYSKPELKIFLQKINNEKTIMVSELDGKLKCFLAVAFRRDLGKNFARVSKPLSHSSHSG